MKKAFWICLLGVCLTVVLVSGQKVKLPDLQGSVFPAEIVESHLLGDRWPVDLSLLLDPPRTTIALSGFVVILEKGYVVARMASAFCAGPGADLRIYETGLEWGGHKDRFSVYVSEDGETWDWVETTPNDAGLSYAAVELGDREGVFRYIKVLCRSGGENEMMGLVAIEALHPCGDD
ncbi:hypothetical protein ACFLTM_02845 [Candidatus Bipolaricaulota bacterium]